MLIDMILHNPAEPELQTRYRDPAVVHALGYQAIVIPNALAALAAGPAPATVDATTARPGPLTPQQLQAAIDAQVSAAIGLGMKVFFHVESVLPQHLAEKHPDVLCDDHSNRLCPAHDGAEVLFRQQIESLLARWPAAAGIVLTAPTSADCTKCRELSPLDRALRLISLLHTTVCDSRGKCLIVRLASQAALYSDLSQRLPRSDRLIFSLPLTGDPATLRTTLRSDAHAKWLEFPSEGPLEGKGAFPNYQAAAWRRTIGELFPPAPQDQPSANPRLPIDICGISRGGGGGFGGPYPQREEWIDANVHALARLYQQPDADPIDLATQWAGITFNIAESSAPAPAIAELLLLSPTVVRKLLYISALAGDPDAPPMPFLRNDLLDVEALWLAAVRLVELGPDEINEALTEKDEALAGVDRIRQDWEIATQELPNKVQARDLANTLAYLGSFAATVVHLLAGFVRFQQWHQAGRADAELASRAQRHIETAESKWQQHVHHHATLPGAPSALHDNTLWQRTNACLAAIENQK